MQAGFDQSGLPIGLQLIANVLKEESLLQVGHQYEIAADVMTNQPRGDFIP